MFSVNIQKKKIFKIRDFWRGETSPGILNRGTCPPSPTVATPMGATGAQFVAERLREKAEAGLADGTLDE